MCSSNIVEALTKHKYFNKFSRVPFDWKNPIGYLIAIIWEYITVVYAFMVVGILTTFGFGTFLLALTALDDVKVGLKKINDLAKFEKNRAQTSNLLGDSIQFHGRLMQLSNLFHKENTSF